MSDLTAAQLRTLLEQGVRPKSLRVFTLACLHGRRLVECYRVKPDEPVLFVYRDALAHAGLDALDMANGPLPIDERVTMRSGGPVRVVDLKEWADTSSRNSWIPAGTGHGCRCLAVVQREHLLTPMAQGLARATFRPLGHSGGRVIVSPSNVRVLRWTV